MQTVTFTNVHGESVSFGNTAPLLLLEITGAGGAKADIQTQRAPFQQGETYLGSVMKPRDVSLEIGIRTQSQEDLFTLRRLISSVFNPTLGPGVLRYEYDGGVKEIYATAEQEPIFMGGSDNKAPGFQRIGVMLTCPESFWLDLYSESEPMAAWVGGIMFPLMLGTTFSEQGMTRTFTNSGDVEAPVEIEFRGPAMNPTVFNHTTGEFIRVRRELREGDVLLVSTYFGRKRVEIVDKNGSRQNVFNWIDIDSTFWQLVPGENTIEYSSDAGKDQATVKITWRNRYAGV